MSQGDLEYGQFREEWFRKDPAFDARVTQQFADLYEEAAAGETSRTGETRPKVASRWL